MNFTVSLVDACIRSLKLGKAAGCDGSTAGGVHRYVGERIVRWEDGYERVHYASTAGGVRARSTHRCVDQVD
jgi:hypothetical protein